MILGRSGLGLKMGKLYQLSTELWPLIDVILFSYIESIFRGGVSCLPAALLSADCKWTILFFVSEEGIRLQSSPIGYAYLHIIFSNNFATAGNKDIAR